MAKQHSAGEMFDGQHVRAQAWIARRRIARNQVAHASGGRIRVRVDMGRKPAPGGRLTVQFHQHHGLFDDEVAQPKRGGVERERICRHQARLGRRDVRPDRPFKFESISTNGCHPERSEGSATGTNRKVAQQQIPRRCAPRDDTWAISTAC